MKVNPLPPQAYTKETLQKAYTWLLNQSASVKDLATTQDMLISLYLKAQRSGEASLETPSIQNFKQELKSLATMIGDLQTSNPIQTQNTNSNTPSSIITPHIPAQTNSVNSSQSLTHPIPSPLSPSASYTEPLISSPTPKMTTQQNNNSSGSNASLGQLDLQSLQILSDVRHSLNLSSDIEVLRMLISLGYKQVKKMNS